MSIYERETFMVGQHIVQVWQSVIGWKWEVSHVEDDTISGSGYGCDSLTEAMLMALSELTQQTMRNMSQDDVELYKALYPNLTWVRTKGRQPESE